MLKSRIHRKLMKKPRPIKRAVRGKKMTKKSKLPSISKLIKACDKEFSIQVRQNGFGNKESGIRYCFTCNHPNHWKKMHCGHYLSRYYKAARWNFDNARIQCMMCNLWKRGDPITFRQNLINEIGEARVLAVEKLRDASLKLSREYLTNLLQELKSTSIDIKPIKN